MPIDLSTPDVYLNYMFALLQNIEALPVRVYSPQFAGKAVT
jgi:hypothetical protein